MQKILPILITIFSFIQIYGHGAQAQSSDEREKVLPKIHSAYIYHLTKYFLWPSQNIDQDAFVIGVLGGQNIETGKELALMAQKNKANGKDIIIRYFDQPSAITSDCHIIYIPHDYSNYLSDVLNVTQSKPVLIVTAKEGLGKVGSPVNLITINGKTSFELNTTAIEKRSLRFAQQLKAIATII